MVEAFQNAVMRLALCGLGVSLAAMALRSRPVRDAFARMLAIWRGLTAFGRLAVCSFLLVGILVGGDKTNSVGSLPPQQMAAPVERQGSDPCLTGLSANGNLADEMHLVQPQTTRTERRFANWNARGAWQDSFWLPFAEGWVFPHGSNHLSGVEVVSFGQLWTVPFGASAVASIGEPVSIVPGLPSFASELTPSNSYRFAWTDAAINRDTNKLVSAALELFRNGDVSVTTNGVAAHLPRILPFPHNGFGQDTEWVSANFTNATEILAVGYPQWVDAQVGEGLMNGLYKFTATIPDDPPETVQLVVGDLSVAVTNAGEYIFLLEKGIDYEYGIIPFMTNVSYSAVDDVPQTRGVVRGGMRSSSGDATRTWTVDGGYGNEPQTEYALGCVWWLPFFFGSPDVSHIGPEDETQTFTANFADCRQLPAASYLWTASDGLTVHSPDAQTTQITVDSMPSWAQASVSVTATIGDHELNSYLDGFTYGTNDTPQVHLSLDLPEGIVCGGGRQSMVATFHSDVETNGCVVLRCVSGLDKIEMWSAASNGVLVASSNCWAVTRSHTFTCYLQGKVQSDLEGVEFEYKFIPDEGDVRAATAKSTVFECYAQSIDNTHISGLNVVNPSFLNPQSNAVFRVQVSPATIPSSKIQWSVVSGTATFPSGSDGTEVDVLGSSGMVDLEVRVLGATDERMHFKSKVQ